MARKRKNTKGDSPKGKRKCNKLVRSKTRTSKVDQKFYEECEAWDTQHLLHLACPSISLSGEIQAVTRRCTEYSLIPQAVVFILDTERSRIDITKKLKEYINKTSASDLRRLCTVNYGKMTVADKVKFESNFDFDPKAFILAENFKWEEFLARVELLFVTWQTGDSHFGLLKKVPEWDLFPFGWDAADLEDGQKIYRAPFDCFSKFLDVPLKNSDGQWICKDSEKKNGHS